MWRLCSKIYFIGNSFWKFYDVRSERGDFDSCGKWSSRMVPLMLWWSLAWFPYFYSDCPWPYCDWKHKTLCNLYCFILFTQSDTTFTKKTNINGISNVITSSWDQTTKQRIFVFPNFFLDFFSVWVVEKESKLFFGSKQVFLSLPVEKEIIINFRYIKKS